jgi:hypothetical protein
MLDAVAVGVRPEAIKALRERRDADLTEHELRLAAYMRGMIARTVTREAYRELEQRLGVRGAVEYAALVGHLLMTARIIQALGVAQPSVEEIGARLAGVLDGTLDLPDPRVRIPAAQRTSTPTGTTPV